MATPLRESAFVAVDMVVLTLRQETLHVVLAERTSETECGKWALPGGYLVPGETTEETVYRSLEDGIGIGRDDVVLEQLKAYSHPQRDPRPERVISVGWMVLGAGLPEPSAHDAAYRGIAWVPVKDALRRPLAFDHADIIRDGLERAREKLENTQLAMAFLEPEFTMSDLRTVYEAVWGGRLEPANFHRKVLSVPGFVEATGTNRNGRGRPARLYRAGPAASIHPPLTRASVRDDLSA